MFSKRVTIEQVEEGTELAPKFDESGLIACVTTAATSGEVLMLGYMNQEALEKTIETGEAHYYSRSRKVLWHKGATSGLVQKVREMRCGFRSKYRVMLAAMWGIAHAFTVRYLLEVIKISHWNLKKIRRCSTRNRSMATHRIRRYCKCNYRRMTLAFIVTQCANQLNRGAIFLV
jgi:phosphoribosyl-AMP cyclohydrolase